MRTATLALLLSLFACPAFSQAADTPAFDMHVHLRDGEASLQQYRNDAASHGIAPSGLAAMWFGGPQQAREGDPDDIRERNDALVTLAAAHPDVVPVGTVHPYDGQAALDELARIAGRGVRMLKLHAHTQGFDVADPRVLALVRKAGELGVVVLMDNASLLPGDNQKLFNLAAQAADTKLILAHIGGLDFRYWNILALARTADGFGFENLHFDISATVLLAADTPLEEEFVWTLRNVGIERVLLGSDYPQISLKRTLDAFEKLDLTDEEKARIRSGNARRLLGL